VNAILKEKFRLISLLTPSRLWNVLLIISGYWLSIAFKRNIVLGLPYAITFEPTNICNLHCPECPTGKGILTRPIGKADLAVFKKLINETKRHSFYINLYFQGEPFLHPELPAMIKYAVNAKMFVSVSTNAHFINETVASHIIEAGTGRVIISLDGLNQESHSFYRKGGDFNTVLKSIGVLKHAREIAKVKQPVLIMQCLALPVNEAFIDEIYSFGMAVGVDKVEIKTAQIYDFENGSPFMVFNDRYSRYRKNKNGKWTIKSRLANRCWAVWSSTVVTWDGLVVPCCFDKNASYVFGQIGDSGFKQVWKSQLSADFRQGVLLNRKGKEICRNCTEGLKI